MIDIRILASEHLIWKYILMKEDNDALGQKDGDENGTG